MILFLSLNAQPDVKTGSIFKSLFIAECGIGYSQNLSIKGYDDNVSGGGLNGTFRLRWETNKKFGFGFEAGYLALAAQSEDNAMTKSGITDYDMNMYAIPLILFFNLEHNNIQFSAGTGIYKVYSEIDALGETSSSSLSDMGYIVSLGYNYPIYTDYGINTHLKWNYISDIKTSVISGMVYFYYRFPEM
ncbi:hypothetical protein ACFLSQ_01915 [Bacteroidota bacterium]